LENNDDRIKDEQCVCGHLKSEHTSVSYFLKPEKDGIVPKHHREKGCGRCSKPDCECMHYVWKKFVFKNEK
jgi:hypothetical protein